MKRSRRAYMLSALLAACGSAHAQSFTQAFDDMTVVLGAGSDWFTVNNSENPDPGVTGWFQGISDTRITAHQGATGIEYAGANYQATQGLNGTEIIAMWLVLPSRTVRNGDTLSFFARAVTPLTTIYPDRLQVRLSTAGSGTNVGADSTTLGDFTTLLLDINPTYSQNTNPGPPTGNPPTVNGFPITYTQYTLTLSGLPAAGVTGRFAFRYFVENAGFNGVNSNFIGVDTLAYTAASAGGCYANCDNSSNPPILNSLDFGCFLTKFAQGDTYANCDNSSNPPVLNSLDFGCFLTKFAAGCT